MSGISGGGGEGFKGWLDTGIQAGALVNSVFQNYYNRKEDRRVADQTHALSRERFEFEKRLIEEKRRRERRIRDLLLGFGG